MNLFSLFITKVNNFAIIHCFAVSFCAFLFVILLSSNYGTDAMAKQVHTYSHTNAIDSASQQVQNFL